MGRANKVVSRHPLQDKTNFIFFKNKEGPRNILPNQQENNDNKGETYNKGNNSKEIKNNVSLNSKIMKELKVVLNPRHASVLHDNIDLSDSNKTCVDAESFCPKQFIQKKVDLKTKPLKQRYQSRNHIKKPLEHLPETELFKLGRSKEFDIENAQRKQKDIYVNLSEFNFIKYVKNGEPKKVVNDTCSNSQVTQVQAPQDQQVMKPAKTCGSTKKLFDHGKQVNRELKWPSEEVQVVHERSQDYENEFFGFSKDQQGEFAIFKTKIDSFQSQPTEPTPRSLKVVLEKLPLLDTSPEFLGFSNTDKKNVGPLFTPRILKVLLKRTKPNDGSSVKNIVSISGSNISLNNIKESKETQDLLANLSTKEHGNKILQISIKRNSGLERKILTQIDGVSHLSETDLDNNIPITNSQTQDNVSELTPDTSSEFYGFEKGAPQSSLLTNIFENSVAELEDYLRVLSEESICNRSTKIFPEQKSESAYKSKKVKIKTNPQPKREKPEKQPKSLPTDANQKSKSQLTNKKNTTKAKKVHQVPENCNKREILPKVQPDIFSKTTLINEQDFPQPDHELVVSKNIQKNYLYDIAEESLKENEHILRKKSPKNYNEESTICNTDELQAERKKKKIPVYKQFSFANLAKKPKEDEYEFTDLSPKKKTKKIQIKRSSGFFDKNTHQIVKKLEKKELKKKRQIKGSKFQNANSYKTTVNKIVCNALQKVNQKKIDKVITHQEKNNVNIKGHPDVNNKISIKAVVHVGSPDKSVSYDQEIISKIVPDNNLQVKMIMHKTSPKVKNKDIIVMSEKLPSRFFFDQLADEITSVESAIPLTVPVIQISALQTDAKNISCNDPSVIQSDIQSFFGFNNHIVNVPQTSSPIPSKLNLISNVVLNQRVQTPLIDSPINFNVRRPNANSTMMGNNFGMPVANRQPESPWRLDLIHIRQNPHFVSVKATGLPRIDQEMVLEHTLVEEFESHCTKTSFLEESRRSPVQQSILNYVECDEELLEKENLNTNRKSLFDYEDFNSPIKKTRANNKAQTVKRKILCDSDENIIHTEPDKSDDANDRTFFGFDENSLQADLDKHNDENRRTKTIETSKPCRFDPNIIKKYVSKKHRLKEKQLDKLSKKQTETVPIEDVPSVSILNITDNQSSGESHPDNAKVCLFEDPEELFDSQPVEIRIKKTKRARADYSAEDPHDDDRYRRKKKTKFEIEQEKWIMSFNKELEEVDNFDLETETD